MRCFARLQRLGVIGGIAVLCLGSAVACGSSQSSQASSGGSAGASTPGVDQAIRAKFPKDILNKGTLRVAVEAPNPPNSTLDNGTLGGIDYDLLTDVAKLAGLKAQFNVVQFTSLIPSLQAGSADVLGTLLPSSDRLTVANFAVYFKVPYGILVPKGNQLHVQDAADLCGHTVALVQASTPPQKLVANRQKVCQSENKAAIKTRLYSDQNTAVLAVQSGEAQAFIQSQAVTAYIAHTADNGQAYTSVSDLKGLDGVTYFPDAYGVLKSNHQLLTALEAALQKLVDNGTYKKVLDQYGVGDDAVKTITTNQLSPADLSP